MKSRAIGLDIGTTGVKGVLIDRSGVILAEETIAHDLHSPRSGWAEESPDEWWQGTLRVLRSLAQSPARHTDTIAAIGVSGMVPALVLLDDDGQPIRPSIQQNDARATTEIAALTRELDQRSLYVRTGGLTNQQHIAPRLRWVQQHEPEHWQRTRTILGSYDYIAAKLAGKDPNHCSVELNWAIESGLLDLRTEQWLPDLLAAAALPRTMLPPIHHPTDVIGTLNPDVAATVGLSGEIPIIAGSADHVASALAAGLREDGDTLIKFGGAGDILYCTSTLITHPKLFIDAHDIPGKYLLNGCMAASRSLVKWYIGDLLGRPVTKTTFVDLDEAAARVSAGADGLVVLPYFLGEKTPLMDPQARGVIFGLDLHHRPEHIFRAILEAVMYGFRHHFDVLRQAGHQPTRLVATNGGVTSGLWRQIAADILGMPISSFRHHPGSSLGVAFVAGMASGLFSDWADIDRFLGEHVINKPEPSVQSIYDTRYRTYRALYEHVKDLYNRS